MANSEDPDEAARNDISSGSTLFAKISILASRHDMVNKKMLTCYVISILKRTRFVLVLISSASLNISPNFSTSKTYTEGT